MKAMVYERYGSPDVLEMRDVPKPVPKDDEILVRVRATTVTSGDWRVRSLELPAGFGPLGRLMFGIRKPRQPILGVEFAGMVEAVGKSVTRFRAGDAVFGIDGMRMGCHAEFKCIRETGAVVGKPEGLGFEEAACLPFGGTTALDFLRRGRVKAGEKVLVNGASGAVGTAAVQLARHLGAEVTAVCSGENADLVKSLGAESVIDYKREDFTRNGRTYDVIMDTAGTAPFSRCKGSLREGGRLLIVLGGLPSLLAVPWRNLTSGRKVVAGPAGERAEDVGLLGELAASGRFRPVIERHFAFEELAEAHRHVDRGRKKGNVVVTA
jgi:NADPH:quinone reductase-like Zn-dependent oxidoreductase